MGIHKHRAKLRKKETKQLYQITYHCSREWACGWDFIYCVYVLDLKATFNVDFAKHQDMNDFWKKLEDEEERGGEKEGRKSSKDAAPN